MSEGKSENGLSGLINREGVNRRRGHVAGRMSSNVLKEIEKASAEWGHDRRRC
jgi:hypothetical protein